MYPIFPFLTCEFSRGWHVSEREAEVAQVLVAAIVDRSQVLPLLDRRGKVHRVQRDLQLACKRRETLNNTLGNDATARNAKGLFLGLSMLLPFHLIEARVRTTNRERRQRGRLVGKHYQTFGIKL